MLSKNRLEAAIATTITTSEKNQRFLLLGFYLLLRHRRNALRGELRICRALRKKIF